jgi:hypothetical protein
LQGALKFGDLVVEEIDDFLVHYLPQFLEQGSNA